MATIQLVHVDVELGDVRVLHDVDLAIDSGEAVAILGGSGSGKTTLLRTIAGFEQPSRGTILLDGHDMARVPPHERQLAMVAQGAPLQSHLTVAGNVEFPLRIQRMAQEERGRRVWAELRAFKLLDLARRLPNRLSAGERHVAATAHSLVKGPRALLLDEPVSALDPDNRRRVLDELRQAHRGYGTTMVVATNDRQVAASIGERVAVIEDGGIAQFGDFQSLHREPATFEVADLTGAWSINRLPTVAQSVPGRRTALPTPAGVLHTWSPAASPGQRLVVGIRPEDLVVAAGGSLRGVVEQVATLGHVVQLHVAVQGVPLVATCPVPGPHVGATVALEPRSLHLFTVEGRALAHLHDPA